MTAFIIATMIKATVVVLVVLTGCAYSTWLERKLLGRLQHRIGPNVAGPAGLLQPIADAIKLAFKEDIVPAKAEKLTFALAPLIAFIPSLLSFAVIPFGNTATIMGYQIDMVISDLNVGILFIFAITSLGVYGIVLAGWSSGSKYSLLGGVRSSAQMISYEIAYGLSIIGVLVIAQSLSLKEIVAQQSSFFDWFIFRQPAGFIIFVICAIAETNRAPFDLPEAESELVGGYHTEYSSMRFALFFVGEYANMITAAAVVTTIFLGGWQGPFFPPVVWFVIKVFLFMAFYIWVRGTLPRFRYDQLMSFGWKVLFPLALLNVLITALIYRI
nr:NADH-quinone oxidoreductase subunit NuoH [candidate division Zixibacteria bacterium]